MAQPSFGIDPVEFGRADQRVDGGGTFAARVGARKQIVAAADSHATQSTLGGGVVDFDCAVIAVACQCRPQIERVQDGCRCIRLARQLLERGAQPAFKAVEQGLEKLSRKSDTSAAILYS